MTRIDAAREAAGKTREQFTPYTVSAQDAAAHYAEQVWRRLGPHAQAAVEQGRHVAKAAHGTVDSRIAPLWESARTTLPSGVEEAASKAAIRARSAARTAGASACAAAVQARGVSVPAVGHALDRAAQATTAAAHTARDRGAAALPALRGQITPAQIQELMAQHTARTRRSTWGKRIMVLGALGAAAAGTRAAWKWWHQQTTPDWLLEPPTEEPQPSHSTPVAATSPPTNTAPPKPDPEDDPDIVTWHPTQDDD